MRDLGSYARFLETMSFSHAQLINTNIANECHLSRTTVDGYIQITHDLLLSYTLPVFSKRAKRAVTTHPKFYFFDAGVYNSLRPRGPADRPEEIHGAALEGLVGQHLRAWIDSQQENYTLSFWRTRAGAEVDFIIYGADEFWAIEVKHSEQLANKEANGLLAFCEDYPEATPLIVYHGKKRTLLKGILCIPCEEFLMSIRPYQKLKASLPTL